MYEFIQFFCLIVLLAIVLGIPIVTLVYMTRMSAPELRKFCNRVAGFWC